MFSTRPKRARDRHSVAGVSHHHEEDVNRRASSNDFGSMYDDFGGLSISGSASIGSFSTMASESTAWDPSIPTPLVPPRRKRTEASKFLSMNFHSNPLRTAMKLSGILAEIPSPVDEDEDGMPRSVLDFSRKEIPRQSQSTASSGLTTLMTSDTISPINPFEEYRSCSAFDRKNPPMKVRVFFPHCEPPSGSLSYQCLTIRRNATVRDLIGYALWNHCHDEWTPAIISSNDPDEIQAAAKTMDDWSLFVVEKGGLIQYDMIPGSSDKLDYLGLSRDYAIMKVPTPSPHETITPNLKPRRRSTVSSLQTSKDHRHHGRSLSMVVSSSRDESSQELRSVKVLFPECFGPAAVVIDASPRGYIKHVLNLVCKELGLEHPEDFAFLVVNSVHGLRSISLTRTVSSLGHRDELILTRRRVRTFLT